MYSTHRYSIVGVRLTIHMEIHIKFFVSEIMTKDYKIFIGNIPFILTAGRVTLTSIISSVITGASDKLS